MVVKCLWARLIPCSSGSGQGKGGGLGSNTTMLNDNDNDHGGTTSCAVKEVRRPLAWLGAQGGSLGLLQGSIVVKAMVKV